MDEIPAAWQNIEISQTEMAAIRTLSDFDLTMLLSELHHHGWPAAKALLLLILQAEMAQAARGKTDG